MLKNTDSQYGYFNIMAHWLTAVIVIGLFCLGIWMISLDYYHPWYKDAPQIHRSLGILLALLIVLRLLLRLFMPVPKPLASLKRWERITSVLVHWSMYGLVLITIILGYLISTADGRAISVFGWFEIPATLTSIPQQADLAGELHYYFAVTLLILVGIHALAAIKHHFIDKDTTLLRMLGRER
ncbi:MAG: cytochrome b [Gammaproteobacteria bacterium]|nr:cytochrome b [Gammaproteobacteria bacterium]